MSFDEQAKAELDAKMARAEQAKDDVGPDASGKGDGIVDEAKDKLHGLVDKAKDTIHHATDRGR